MLYVDLVASIKDNPAVKNQAKEIWVEFLLKLRAWNEISILNIFHTHRLTRFYFHYCSNKAKQINFFVILESKHIQVCCISKFWISVDFKLQEIWQASKTLQNKLTNQPKTNPKPPSNKQRKPSQ